MCDANKINDLYAALTEIDNINDCKNFLNDLCTEKEIEAMAQRLYAAKLLIEGNTYEQVIKKTELSSATLSRISKSIKSGNGYRKIIKLN